MSRGEGTATVPTRSLLTRMSVRISPLTAARRVCIGARDFWGEWGRLPSFFLLAVALPPPHPSQAEAAHRNSGGQGGGPGERRAAGNGGGPPAQPRSRPAAEIRALGAGGGRGGIPLSVPAISRAWEPGKQNALAISSRR